MKNLLQKLFLLTVLFLSGCTTIETIDPLEIVAGKTGKYTNTDGERTFSIESDASMYYEYDLDGGIEYFMAYYESGVNWVSYSTADPQGVDVITLSDLTDSGGVYTRKIGSSAEYTTKFSWVAE